MKKQYYPLAQTEMISLLRSINRRLGVLCGEIEPSKYDCEEERKRLFEEYGEVLTVTQAAGILGVTRATVYKRLREGKILRSADGTHITTHSVADFVYGRET